MDLGPSGAKPLRFGGLATEALRDYGECLDFCQVSSNQVVGRFPTTKTQDAAGAGNLARSVVRLSIAYVEPLLIVRSWVCLHRELQGDMGYLDIGLLFQRISLRRFDNVGLKLR